MYNNLISVRNYAHEYIFSLFNYLFQQRLNKIKKITYVSCLPKSILYLSFYVI